MGTASSRRINPGQFVDAVLLVLAVAAVSLLALTYFRPRTAPGPDPRAQEVLERMVGHPLRQGTPDARARPTLTIVFAATCGYCELTAPRWSAIVRAGGDRVRVMAATSDVDSTARAWLASAGIAVDTLIAGSSAAAWGIPGVPVTIVSDSGLTVRSIRIGALTGAQSDSVRSELLRFATHRPHVSAHPDVDE